MEVVVSTTPAKTAAEQLSALLEQHADTPTLLLLSGGSALSILDHLPDTTFGPQLTFTVLDERFSTDPAVNNFDQVQKTNFYTTALERGVVALDTTVQPEDTLATAGARFEQMLRDWRAKHPTGEVVAVMGVGPDGHTAGILPGEYGVDFEGESWVVAYTVPASVNPYTERMTVTYTFLRTQVTAVLAYATGREKQSVIKTIQSQTCPLATTPACIISTLKQVTLVTDCEQ